MATSTDLRSAIEEVQQQLPVDQVTGGALPPEIAEAGLDRLARRVGALPWWVISAATHAVLFLLIALLATAVAPQKQDEVVISTDVVKQKPPEYDPQKKRDIFKNVKEVTAESNVETPVVVHEKIEESDTFETDNNMDKQSARGNEDAISDIPLGGTGTVGSIGVGGGGMAGVFGYRDGGGRKKAVGRFGGSEATESSVEAALRWLARHQEKDGRWASEKWDAKNDKRASMSMTGLATLAFLGAGYTHKSGRFADNVRRGLEWLMSQQVENGGVTGKQGFSYNHYDGYSHAMASLALAEAWGMTEANRRDDFDSKLGQAAQKAVDYSVNVHQKPYSGWRYQAGSEGDISHTGWFVMQLKSAKVAGLKVDGTAFQGGMNFVTSLLGKDTGKSVYEKSQISSANYMGAGPKGGDLGSARRTAMSMVCRLFMGVPRDDETMKKSAPWVLGYKPDWEKQDFYHWYYGTLAMFQTGGDNWKEWNDPMKKTLVDNQCKGGPMDGSANDKDGSWDPKGHYEEQCGRIYTTALGALCLEVYYRYLPMYSK
ncbi:MAG TPA: terpene cyclase/mutase family protein [Planctomycetota bacterium]|nr:terpene cyclase/mutase family protein [Planctomycetota bacterium]